MKLHNLILIVTIGLALFVSYAGFSLIPYLYGPKIPTNNNTTFIGFTRVALSSTASKMVMSSS